MRPLFRRTYAEREWFPEFGSFGIELAMDGFEVRTIRACLTHRRNLRKLILELRYDIPEPPQISSHPLPSDSLFRRGGWSPRRL